jgi:molecular chaperone GrpE
VRRRKTRRASTDEGHHDPIEHATEGVAFDRVEPAGSREDERPRPPAGQGQDGVDGQPAADLQLIENKPVAEIAASIPLEQHQRLLAEFDNFRKRTQTQQGRVSRLIRDELIVRLLPILDDCDRAQQAALSNPVHFDREGALIILRRLAEALRQEGLAKVEAAPGMEFDPEVHEAVLTIPTADVPEGSIAEVLEPGYRSTDRLLRPAKVAVARAPAPDASPRDDPG